MSNDNGANVTGNEKSTGVGDKQEKGFMPTSDEDNSYSSFPDRDLKQGPKPWTLKDILYYDFRGPLLHNRCELNVIHCARNDPLIRLMLRALKSHGCEMKFSRHFSCERCVGKANGGYDTVMNQVVVCENVTRGRDGVCSVVAHELTHAFDKCRAKIDFTNLEHLACTEIRASIFSHCNFATALANREASMWEYTKSHQACVKNKAMMSVMAARDVTPDKAMEAIDKVFDKCYADLEPVGRIPRKFTRDSNLSLVEGELYGYID